MCGDPYDGPRLHETGHPMAQNETVRNFFPGSSIDVLIQIVANHGGYFNFDICWRDGWNSSETESCFEKLRLSGKNHTMKNSTENTVNRDGSDQDDGERSSLSERAYAFTYNLDASKGAGIYAMSVDLPENRTCENCVLRWHWKTANNWGACEDGSEAIGCGHQEVYRNCADISVKRDGAGIGSGASL